jgi:membrane-associated phospholipid phosphatase
MTRRRVRAVAATAVFIGLAEHASRGRVSAFEERVFRTVNALPDWVNGPLWVVMQSGSLAAVGVASGVAAAAKNRDAALRLGIAGTAMWGFCKVVKHSIGRGRPGAHLDAVVVRGLPQTGLGFPSGHTAVAFTLAGVAAPYLPREFAVGGLIGAGVVGIARMYVGAHLPADIAGGIAAGVAAAAAARL